MVNIPWVDQIFHDISLSVPYLSNSLSFPGFPVFQSVWPSCIKVLVLLPCQFIGNWLRSLNRPTNTFTRKKQLFQPVCYQNNTSAPDEFTLEFKVYADSHSENNAIAGSTQYEVSWAGYCWLLHSATWLILHWLQERCLISKRSCWQTKHFGQLQSSYQLQWQWMDQLDRSTAANIHWWLHTEPQYLNSA